MGTRAFEALGYDVPPISVVPSAETEEMAAARVDRQQRAALQAFGLGLRLWCEGTIVGVLQLTANAVQHTFAQGREDSVEAIDALIKATTYTSVQMTLRKDVIALITIYAPNDRFKRIEVRPIKGIDDATIAARAFLDAVAEELGR